MALTAAQEAVLARLADFLLGAAPSAPSGGSSGAIADARELDSEYGDPQVKFDPRDWAGDTCVGLRFSECPPDFLDVLAESKDWASRNPKPGKERYAAYDAKDAARARGWSARLRAGWKPRAASASRSSSSREPDPPAGYVPDGQYDDDPPF